MPSHFPCSPVIREWSWKKTHIEKKTTKKQKNRHSIPIRTHQLQMKMGEKLCNFIILYRSPSQSQDDFESFLKNFELNLDTISANKPF